jgi:hypothetical protein
MPHLCGATCTDATELLPLWHLFLEEVAKAHAQDFLKANCAIVMKLLLYCEHFVNTNSRRSSFFFIILFNNTSLYTIFSVFPHNVLKEKTLNLAYLSLNSCYKNKRVWRHTSLLLFIVVWLHDYKFCMHCKPYSCLATKEPWAWINLCINKLRGC